MRPFPANKPFLILLCAGALLLPLRAAHAQQQQQQQMTTQQQEQFQKISEAMMSSLPPRPSFAPNTPPPGGASGAFTDLVMPMPQQREPMTQAEYDRLVQNPDSAQAKAEKLARKRSSQRNLEKNLSIAAGDEPLGAPPPEDLEELQGLGLGVEYKALDDVGGDNLPKDDPSTAIDLRRDAQKEAALSFGARGGLAKRNFEIMERLTGFEATLDQVFNFRALLVKAPSGLLIEPPIVREAVDSLVVTRNGNEAAVADRIYDINKQSKIVTAPRDWRTYLVQRWVTVVPKPPRLLWPKNEKERERWNEWVLLGWRAGAAQADAMFEANLARLTADYQGMVRYRMLLTQGMISQPYAMHEDRGVTGTKTVMRVGDRALRITGPSQFLTTGSDLWKPADR